VKPQRQTTMTPMSISTGIDNDDDINETEGRGAALHKLTRQH